MVCEFTPGGGVGFESVLVHFSLWAFSPWMTSGYLRAVEMKSFLKVIVYCGLFGLSGLGIATAITNPGRSDYEEYAIETLTDYLKAEVCSKAPSFLGFSLESQCQTLVDTGQPNLEGMIAQGTQRQNFIFFSVYKTDLTLVPPLPSYHFETIGVLQRFYTYEADEIER